MGIAIIPRLSPQQNKIRTLLIKANAPMTAAEIALAIGKNKEGKANIRRQILRIREKLGKDCIGRLGTNGYVWIGETACTKWNV